MGYEFRAHLFVRKCRVSGTRARTDKASFRTTIEKLRAHRSARVGASRVQIRTVHDDEAPPRACTKRGASDPKHFSETGSPSHLSGNAMNAQAPEGLRPARCRRWRLKCVLLNHSIRNPQLGSSSLLVSIALV